MLLKYDSYILGEFNGWNGDTVFELVNGTKWKQARYRYEYFYKNQPRVKILQDGGRYMALVDGRDKLMEVSRV